MPTGSLTSGPAPGTTAVASCSPAPADLVAAGSTLTGEHLAAYVRSTRPGRRRVERTQRG